MALSTLDELMNHLAQFEPTGFPVISLYLNAEADQYPVISLKKDALYGPACTGPQPKELT